MKSAMAIIAGAVTYTWDDLLEPKTGAADSWDGRLDTIGSLRCDGLIEVCYELSGVPVWGMERRPDNHAVHFDVTSQTDSWSYDGLANVWSMVSNSLKDNLEEHNDMDWSEWDDTLMPATQAGYRAPVDAVTRFVRQNLCAPVGSKGGNP